MTILIDLSPQTHKRLEVLASKNGQALEVFLSDLIETSIGADEPIDAVLSPFREGFAESGISEDEATALLDDGLKAVRAARRTERIA